MAIALVGTPQIGTANQGGDVTLTFDGTPQEDDVAILIGGNSAGTAADGFGPVTSGYTALATHGAERPLVGVWAKVMGASPDSAVVGEGSGFASIAAVYGCYVLRGVDTANISDVTPTATGPSTAATMDNPSIITVTDGAWVIAVVGNSSDSTSPGTIAGYLNTIAAGEIDTVRYAAGAATREIASATSENPPAWSSSTGSTWYAITVAIRPTGVAATDLDGTDATQAQTATQPALTQTHELQPASVVQAQTATQAAVQQGVTLTPASAVQAQSAATAALSQTHELTAADALQTQQADAAALTQLHELVAADAVQAQNVDLPALSLGLIVTPPERTLVVPAEDRVLRVAAESRTRIVPAEDRRLVVT